MNGTLQRLVRSARRLPGWMLLSAGDDLLAAEPPERFARAWWQLMLVSFGWGLALTWVWGAAWALFRDVEGLLVRPALAATAALALGPLRRAIAAGAEMLGGAEGAAALLVMTLAGCLLGLDANFYSFEPPLPWWLAWVRPPAKLYRVLMLMPLWGGWSMLVVAQLCRPNERTEPAVAAFARGCGPVATAACMGALLAATIQYFNYLPWRQLCISGAAAASAIVGGLVLCRICGGLRRKALLAANLLTQIVFALAYLANR